MCMKWEFSGSSIFARVRALDTYTFSHLFLVNATPPTLRIWMKLGTMQGDDANMCRNWDFLVRQFCQQLWPSVHYHVQLRGGLLIGWLQWWGVETKQISSFNIQQQPSTWYNNIFRSRIPVHHNLIHSIKVLNLIYMLDIEAYMIHLNALLWCSFSIFSGQVVL
jgi:hypothetical protein